MLKTSFKQLKNKKSNHVSPKSRLELVKENKYKKVNATRIFRKIRFGKRAKKAAIILVGVFFIALTVGAVAVLSILQDINNKLPTPDKIFPELPLATEVFDRHGLDGPDRGTILYKLFGEANSDKLEIADIPDSVRAVFLAAEDDNFYIHNGYDPSAIIRCGINALRKTNICGGSTITQQLIKTITKDNVVGIDRKIRELLMAIKVEDNYDKDQIFEMYLRATSYGSNIVGYKAASAFYFYKDPTKPELGGKEPKELTLAEAAAIAGIVRNPAFLSPTLGADTASSQEALQERMNFIFDQMEAKLDSFNTQLKKNKGIDNSSPDIITKEMIDAARTEEWSKNLRPPIATDIKAGHFTNYVLQTLQSGNYNNGGTEPFTLTQLQTGGYKIYTSLDYDMQKVAEDKVKNAGGDYTYWNMHNAALMTTQPSTGQILAMAGSKSFFGQSEGCDGDGQNCQYNPEVNVLTSYQSPGSTNKPMGYYLAFKNGNIFPGSLLPDMPIKIGSYEPKNWNGGYLGEHVSAREMLRQSRNIPALQVVQMVGTENYVKTAQEWGYTTYNGDYGQSVILGGADILPVEHAQAFGVFANAGDLVPLNPILKIVDKDGNTVYEAQPQRKAVGDQQAIYLLNQTLNRLDTLGASVAWDDRDVAGKTGTSEENKDSWVMMWSPDFVTLGWGGNNNNDPLDQYYGYPAFVVIPWVRQYMADISNYPYFTAKTPFPRPGFVYQGGGDCDATGACLGIQRDWLIQGREPKRGDFNHKKVTVCTDQQDRIARPIDIALGLSMVKEFNYYKNPVAEWQGNLDDWIKGHTITNGGPQSNCDIDRTGGVTNGPFFRINSISAPTTASVSIQGGVFSSTIGGNVTSIKFYIDNNEIPGCAVAAADYGDFDITCDITSMFLDDGVYKFNISATDDSFAGTNYLGAQDLIIGNSISGNFDFGTSLPPATCNVTPVNNCITTIRAAYNFASNPGITNVRLCILKNGSLTGCNATSLVAGKYTYAWTPTSAGTYAFYMTATAPSGQGTITSQTSGNTVAN